MAIDLKQLIESQIKYYRARSTEYDEWFLRQGRYDYGPELNQQWFNEVKQASEVLARFNPVGEVLELACGTGWWTEQLARYANHITALDASAEVIAINHQRLSQLSNKVSYQQVDLFQWIPDQQYDVVFFSFWLSHVPSQYFEQFWKMVLKALKPNGRIFFIDSLCATTATAQNQLIDDKNHINIRHLKDGRQFSIVKIFYKPNELQLKLQKIGIKDIDITQTEHYFLIGYTKQS